jgi:hypothetical protein
LSQAHLAKDTIRWEMGRRDLFVSPYPFEIGGKTDRSLAARRAKSSDHLRPTFGSTTKLQHIH